MKIRTIVITVLLTIITTSAYAGWVFTESGNSENQTTYIQNNKMKLVNADQIMIVDVAKNQLCFANPKQKTFWRGTPSQLASEAGKIMNDMDKMMDEQLSAIPAEQRDMLKQALRDQITPGKNSPNPNAQVVDTGLGDTIAGYPARKYEIRVDGKLSEALWITGGIKMGSEFDVRRFSEMMRSLTSGISMIGDYAAMSSPQVMSLLEKGWPLRVVDYQGGKYNMLSDVIKVEKKSISPATFDIPKDYQQSSVVDIFGR
ncbi:MAG: hypothetical protein BWK80_48640 [Desulfobacteraceae bacterium IS3]|nr:MAG: hypothetical protein BWK80_48640 [Desulfobacteraceae bacterium IS3]